MTCAEQRPFAASTRSRLPLPPLTQWLRPYGSECASSSESRQQSRLPTHSILDTRAKQDIPPATRGAVLHRDHHRCRVPGCRNATFLDVHHLWLRDDGGAHDAANLIAMCSAHHGALHRGQLRTEGDAQSLRVLHADGSAYGQPVEPRNVEVQTKVFSGLRGLGFRESEVRTVMAELRQRVELREATAERWLRGALLRLHRPAPVPR